MEPMDLYGIALSMSLVCNVALLARLWNTKKRLDNVVKKSRRHSSIDLTTVP